MSNNELIDKIIEEIYYKTDTSLGFHPSYHFEYITKDDLEEYLESLKTKE